MLAFTGAVKQRNTQAKNGAAQRDKDMAPTRVRRRENALGTHNIPALVPAPCVCRSVNIVGCTSRDVAHPSRRTCASNKLAQVLLGIRVDLAVRSLSKRKYVPKWRASPGVRRFCHTARMCPRRHITPECNLSTPRT